MINLFAGPEGGGKTALMTHFLRKHHLAGGEVWALPGYELKNNSGRVVSKLVMPEQLPGLIDDLQYIVLVGDEVQNILNHHNWQSYLANIMAYGAFAQRRKRQFNFFATCPEFKWLPPDIRMMFHMLINCRDPHWANKSIPVGQQTEFSMTDLRGLLSGYPGTTTKRKRFWVTSVYKYFETYSLVDPKYQNLKIRVKKDEVWVDSQGNQIQKKDESYYPEENIEIARMIAELKAQKVKTLQPYELHQKLNDIGLTLTRSVKNILRGTGIYWNPNKQYYNVS